MTMEDYIEGLYPSQLLARQGNYMSSSHVIDSVIDSRPPNHQQSPSFELSTSHPGSVYHFGMQTDFVGLIDDAGIPPAEPGVRISGHCAIDILTSQSDSGDDTTTYFDDEYQAIHTSNLCAADKDSMVHTLGIQSRFNDVEVNGGDHQMDASDSQPTTDSATMRCDPTIVPPAYIPFQSDPPQPRSTSGLDILSGIQAMGAAPSRSLFDDLQVEVFDTSSVMCSKAYATGGAANQDLDCRPMIPQANHRSRLSGEEEAQPRNYKMAEGYMASLNPYRDGVQPARLPFLMKAVGHLSADADSTVASRPIVRPGTNMGSIIESPPPSEAQRILKTLLPQIPNTGSPHTPALPTYDSSSQQQDWVTPPSSNQSSPDYGTTDEVAFSSKHSQLSTSPIITPIATHAILSLPKTLISTPPLDLRKDRLDRIPFHPIYGNLPQLRGYATPPSTSRTMPGTGLTHNPDANGVDFFPSDIPNTTPTPILAAYLSPGNGSTPPASEDIQCEICQKPFHGKPATLLRSLKRHKETEHGGEAYECVQCGERLCRSDYRARHLQSKKHNFQLPPTPPSRKRDPDWELFLQRCFRKVTTRRVEG